MMDSFHSHTVLSKLNEQRSQGLFCDVTIVVEDVKFRAHKNILAACSGYFKNVLTNETWSSSRVLELMDLKSEVFACVLNFIYSSKVTLPCVEDNKDLIAAGKRLGISFLEKLAGHEKRNKNLNRPDCVKPTDWSTASVLKKNKEAATRTEEIDGARGPRITNAFSITEVCPGNNPFTPLEEGRQSPDEGQLPASCPTSSCLDGIKEHSHTFLDHSYAVNQVTEEKGQTSQWDNEKVSKSAPLQPKQTTYRNSGPLKKRHRLRGAVFRNQFLTNTEPHTEKNTLTPILAVGATLAPPRLPQNEQDKLRDAVNPLANSHVHTASSPSTLLPHTEDSIAIYGCKHCPEIFRNESLLAIHSKVHKRCSDGHFLCKFCDKKFIHLKRLRNHEQNCPKAWRGKPKQYSSDVDVKEEDLNSGSMLSEETTKTQFPPVDHPMTGPLLVHQLEHPKDENKKSSSGIQRRYNCSVCKRVYITLSSLKRHENVHSWQRAYPCHYCNKVFALAEYRTKHEIWHTGERRYQCIFCLETFMTYYILKNHQKSFHGIDPTLSIKRKSANGGLKASVYPIKLYRLLPMKFRKRRYKTYSQTYSEGDETDFQLPLDSNPLCPQFEGNSVSGCPNGGSLPLTFMATTKMVAPIMPRISFDKPCNTDIDQSLHHNYHQRATGKDAEHSSPFINFDCTVPLQSDPASSSVDNKGNPLELINSHHINQNVTFLNSLNTVEKLSELSASAKKVEKMTKEMLQSNSETFNLDKTVGAKTETYIAKPVCPGPSADGDAIPLCQITVKIGDEAIIRRRIKGSKLFPRRKKKIRKLGEVESPSQLHPDDKLEIPRLRFRPDISGLISETYEGPNDCDMADELWRPYSYKAKKKKKKLRFKHRQALFHNYNETVRSDTGASEARLDSWQTGDSISGGGDVKHSLRSCSPRTTYNCEICDSSFITETGLRAHIIGSHPYFCRTCGKQGPPGETPSGNDYICNSCMENGSCFDSSTWSPKPEKKFHCSFCPQRFLYLATKRSHEKKHQEKSGESYTTQPCLEYLDNLSEENKKDCIKTEEDDNQEEGSGVQCEEGVQFHIKKPKTEDTTELTLTPHQDITYTHIKSSSPQTEPLFTATSPSKMKHKMKRIINPPHSLDLSFKPQAQKRDANRYKDSLEVSSVNDHEKSCKSSRKNALDLKDGHISANKPEKLMCKDKTFF
ncbi:zinc finger and BTB domain-containing protein 38-like isoform X1 [Phycodurus eques]|uniref:zinc finger and BTB domain-containing protein 38-like isoform X1 n=1 Tax=Phycodurus eques TaxID=693459 RepID=UPI002ACDD0C0|nr:zinc finger and BTB domain-containing protein 38-like isoform X1 [Phycodurus eques]XP_061537123.1 zinc finger and BTB domain-containing protein 38-like isoform X1 [Phycodurus eques]XP_061537124.1 zinc finger and BTB domain-containing protein 38-like isoform X1 [Phycodurus eques]